MADNLPVTPGSGATIALDDIGGVYYPRVKIAAGLDGFHKRDMAFEVPSTTHTISAASTNATSTKASAGWLHFIIATNVNAAVRYLKLYDKASAPTVGTDTPKFIVPIPPSNLTPQFLFFTNPVYFGTGIAWALTTGIANSDTGAVSASEHAIDLGYE